MSRWPDEGMPEVFDSVDADGVWAVSIRDGSAQLDLTEEKLAHVVDLLVEVMLRRAAAAESAEVQP